MCLISPSLERLRSDRQLDNVQMLSSAPGEKAHGTGLESLLTEDERRKSVPGVLERLKKKSFM